MTLEGAWELLTDNESALGRTVTTGVIAGIGWAPAVVLSRLLVTGGIRLMLDTEATVTSFSDWESPSGGSSRIARWRLARQRPAGGDHPSSVAGGGGLAGVQAVPSWASNPSWCRALPEL